MIKKQIILQNQQNSSFPKNFQLVLIACLVVLARWENIFRHKSISSWMYSDCFPPLETGFTLILLRKPKYSSVMSLNLEIGKGPWREEIIYFQELLILIMSIISSLIAAVYYWKTIPIYSAMLSHSNSICFSFK